MMLKRTCPAQAVAVGWLHSPPPPPPPSTQAPSDRGVPLPAYRQHTPADPSERGCSSTVDQLLREVDTPLLDRSSIKAVMSDFVVRLRAYTPRTIGGVLLPEYTTEVLKHQLGELFTQELVQYLRSSHSAPLSAFSCVALAILASPVWVSLATCRLTHLSVHTSPFILSLEGNAQRHWGLNFDSDIRPLTGGVASVSAVSTTCGVLGCQFVNAIQTSSPSAVSDPLFIYTHHVPMEAAGGSVSQLSQGVGGTTIKGSSGMGGVPVPLIAATALRSEMKRRVRRVWGLRGQQPFEDVPFAVARGPHGQPILVSPFYILGKSVAPGGSPTAKTFPNTNSTIQSISLPTKSPFDVDATYSQPLYDDVGAAMAALTDPAVAASIPPGLHPPRTFPSDDTIELKGWISDSGVVMGGPTHVYLESKQPLSRWPFAPWRITVSNACDAEGKSLVSLSGNYLHITQTDSAGVTPFASFVSHHNPYDLSGSPFDPHTSHLMRLRHVSHGWSSSSLWLTEEEAFEVMGATLLPAQQPVLVSNPLQGRQNVDAPTSSLRPYFNVCQFTHTPTHHPLQAGHPVSTSVSGVPLLRDIREVRGAVLVQERACGSKSLLQSEVTLNGTGVATEMREQLRDASRRLGFKSPNFFTTSFIGSIGCTLRTGEYPFPLPSSHLAYDASVTDAFKWPAGYTPTWLPRKEGAAVTSLKARTADNNLSGADRSWAAARLLLESRGATVANLEEELSDRVEAVVGGELLPPWPPLLPPQVSVPIITASRLHYQACRAAPSKYVTVVNADQLSLPVSEGRFRQILQMQVSFVWPHRNMHRFHMLRKVADTEVVAMSHGDPNDTIFCPVDLLRLAGISPLPTAQPLALSHGDFFSWFTELDCDHPFLSASQTSSPDLVAAMYGVQHVSGSGNPIQTNHAKAVLSAFACRRGFLTAANWERPQVWFSIRQLRREGIRLRPCPHQLPGVGETSVEFVGNSEPIGDDPRCIDLEAHYPQYNLAIGGRALFKGSHDARCFVHLRDLSL